MLKITSRNEKRNRQMAHKETNQFFHKLFYCFFVSPQNSKKPLPFRAPKEAKIFRNNKNFFFSTCQKLQFQFHRYSIDWQSQFSFPSSFTKTRTICFLTGRSRSVYRAFRLSRLKIREYAAAGHFTGLSKASW